MCWNSGETERNLKQKGVLTLFWVICCANLMTFILLCREKQAKVSNGGEEEMDGQVCHHKHAVLVDTDT